MLRNHVYTRAFACWAALMILGSPTPSLAAISEPDPQSEQTTDEIVAVPTPEPTAEPTPEPTPEPTADAGEPTADAEEPAAEEPAAQEKAAAPSSTPAPADAGAATIDPVVTGELGAQNPGSETRERRGLSIPVQSDLASGLMASLPSPAGNTEGPSGGSDEAGDGDKTEKKPISRGAAEPTPASAAASKDPIERLGGLSSEVGEILSTNSDKVTDVARARHNLAITKGGPRYDVVNGIPDPKKPGYGMFPGHDALMRGGYVVDTEKFTGFGRMGNCGEKSAALYRRIHIDPAFNDWNVCVAGGDEHAWVEATDPNGQTWLVDPYYGEKPIAITRANGRVTYKDKDIVPRLHQLYAKPSITSVPQKVDMR